MTSRGNTCIRYTEYKPHVMYTLCYVSTGIFSFPPHLFSGATLPWATVET